MKFSKRFFVLAAGAALTLTGCLPADTENIAYPFPKGSYDEPTSAEHEHDRFSAEEIAAAVEGFPIENIVRPDGETVLKSEAVGGNSSYLEFDFGFYEAAPPVFGTSFNNHDLIRYDSNGNPALAVNLSELRGDYGSDCKKVSEGDVLENGLVVNHACSSVNERGEWDTWVSFSGEITLSGYLTYEYHPTHSSDPSNGTLWFIPDTTKSAVSTYINPAKEPPLFIFWGDYMSKKPYLLYSGSHQWRLGNTKSEKYSGHNLEDVFDGKSYAYVTLTVKDPILAPQGGGCLVDTEQAYFGEYKWFETYVTGTITDIR